MRRLALGLALVVVAGCPREVPQTAPTPGPSPAPAETEPPPEPPPRERQIVWVSVEDEPSLVKVDVGSGRVLRSLRFSGTPHNLTVERRTVAVALQDSGRLGMVREGSATEVDLGGSPHDVKVAGDLFVVANEGDARVDLVSADGDHLGSVPLERDPHDLAISPNGRTAWVTMNGDDRLAVVSLERKAVRRYVPTRERPHDLLFAPDGRLWVTDWGGKLHVLDGDRIVESLTLGVEAHHLAFTPDGREAWITDHGAHAVFVLDADTVQVLEEIHTRGAPHHVAISPDGRWAAVADHGGGRLLVYRVATRRLVDRIPVGPGPHGVWAAA